MKTSCPVKIENLWNQLRESWITHGKAAVVASGLCPYQRFNHSKDSWWCWWWLIGTLAITRINYCAMAQSWLEDVSQTAWNNKSCNNKAIHGFKNNTLVCSHTASWDHEPIQLPHSVYIIYEPPESDAPSLWKLDYNLPWTILVDQDGKPGKKCGLATKCWTKGSENFAHR